MIHDWPHGHIFIWVCDDLNRLRCKCACGDDATDTVNAA